MLLTIMFGFGFFFGVLGRILWYLGKLSYWSKDLSDTDK